MFYYLQGEYSFLESVLTDPVYSRPTHQQLGLVIVTGWSHYSHIVYSLPLIIAVVFPFLLSPEGLRCAMEVPFFSSSLSPLYFNSVLHYSWFTLSESFEILVPSRHWASRVALM